MQVLRNLKHAPVIPPASEQASTISGVSKAPSATIPDSKLNAATGADPMAPLSQADFTKAHWWVEAKWKEYWKSLDEATTGKSQSKGKYLNFIEGEDGVPLSKVTLSKIKDSA